MHKHRLAAFAALLSVLAACNPHLVVGVGGSPATSTSTGTVSPPDANGCPAGRGPAMARIPLADAGGYCIDTTEVTQAQYQQFLDAGVSAAGTGFCAYKTTNVPAHEPSDKNMESWVPEVCSAAHPHFDPAATPDHPVVCVDWCDAGAYCAWAGKRLCGRIGGGAPYGEEVSDPALDEWQRACTNGGTTLRPYGDDFVEGACTFTGPGPVAADPTCHGTTAPYSAVYDLLGNVSEWENADLGGSVDGTKGVAIRGASPESASTSAEVRANWAAAQRCGGQLFPGQQSMQYEGDDIESVRPELGFRCCADLAP